MGHRDDHILALDQIFDIVFEFGFDNFGAPRVGELFAHRQQLRPQQPVELLATVENGKKLADSIDQLGQILGDLVALEPG